MGLMKALFFDPILRVQQDRTNKIASDKSEAETGLQQAQTMAQAYEADLAEARKKAQSLMIQVRQETKSKVEALLAETRVQIQDQLDAKARELDTATISVLASLAEEKAQYSNMIVNKVLGESLVSAGEGA
jgi:F-type H+-transporting ATPase subunit b